MPRARDQTHFGFREVPLERKQAMVDDVFHSVAGRYDLMNDLMSGGLHRAWKDALVTAVNPPRARIAVAGEAKAPARPFALLDLAGGTGDISLRVLEAASSGTRATVVDINTDMLTVGRARAAERGLEDAIVFVEGNAEALPFPEQSYDMVTIAGQNNGTNPGDQVFTLPAGAASVSATCRASRPRSPRLIAYCTSAAAFSVWNFPRWMCRVSMQFMSFTHLTLSPCSGASSPATPRRTAIWSNRFVAFRVLISLPT